MDSRSLNSKESHETFISLLQLEPSPIDSPQPDTEKELPPLPEETRESPEVSKGLVQNLSAAPLGLSSGGHGPIYYLTRIQKYSSFAINLFATIHLANTAIIPLVTRSVSASETYLIQAREIYQTPLTEPLLVGIPIITHVASGLALRLYRRSQNLKRYGGATPGMYALHRSRTAVSDSSSSSGSSASTLRSVWPPLSYISASGYVFAVAVWAHVAVNRALPMKFDGGSSNIGLGYVAHGFARHPLVAWVAYSGLIFAGCGHIVWGAFKWLGMAPSTASWSKNQVIGREMRKRRRRSWMAINGIAVAVAGLWAAGGLGIVARGGLADGWVGKLYDDLFAKVGLAS